MIPNNQLTALLKDSKHPRSLIAKQRSPSKCDKSCATCLSTFYDILTILISIADVTTDILVLISFYYENKMIFFYISLAILIVAQLGYLIMFFLSFDVEIMIDNISQCCQDIYFSCECCKHINNYIANVLNTNNKCCICIQLTLFFIFRILIIFGSILLCLLLPFGHLVAFLMYFAQSNHSKFSKWLATNIGIKKRTNIPLEDHLSEMTKFTISKINKHGGFILEAFLEALPQSIIQLIAMVYFKQTNYISVGSILLSMTSIMTKSLVISQGIEWKSYFYTWLCVCTDFFSIFFVVSWVFLDNEYIRGDFLGQFSIIGQIWCWKVIIAIIPPIVFVAIAYLTGGIWFLIYEIWRSNNDEPVYCRIMLILLFLTGGNAIIVFGYCIGAVIAFIFFEILSFTFVALFIWMFLSLDRWDYSDGKISNIISELLYFVSNGSMKHNDKIVRILSINYAYKPFDKLGRYIVQTKENETIHQVSYKDIRDNCSKPRNANIFKSGIKVYFSLPFTIGHADCENKFIRVYVILMVYISGPIYLLSRIATILYPYFIIWYIYYYNLWFKLSLFELAMLGAYVLLQMIVFIFSVFVFRTHLWLWHIIPGVDEYMMDWKNKDVDLFLKNLYNFYDSIQWLPITREILLEKFGQDIGKIIIEYLPSHSDQYY